MGSRWNVEVLRRADDKFGGGNLVAAKTFYDSEWDNPRQEAFHFAYGWLDSTEIVNHVNVWMSDGSNFWAKVLRNTEENRAKAIREDYFYNSREERKTYTRQTKKLETSKGWEAKEFYY